MNSAFAIFSVAFAALSVAALVFFVHKVIWLFRYKRLQRELIERASRMMKHESEDALADWERTCRRCCLDASEGRFDYSTPAGVAEDVSERFDRVREVLAESQTTVEPLLDEVLSQPHDTQTLSSSVLRVPRVLEHSSDLEARVELRAQGLPRPEPPSPELYTLNVRSRYGFIRRALVFFAGIADVIYSSQHISMMSHHSHVPVGVIVRRLLLVILLVAALVAQVLLGLRDEMEPLIGTWLVEQTPFVQGETEAEIASTARLVTIVLWTGGVTVAYFILAILLRRRYRRHLKTLEALKEGEKARLEAITRRHVHDLRAWSHGFSETLDTSVDLTAQQIEMMAHHHETRIQRRICSQELLEQAEQISEALFQQLPESSDSLQDDALSSWRSFRHYLWPRAEEMDDIIEIAQYRDAWQFIELSVGELRRQRIDVERVDQLWRQLVTYAVTFPRVLPESTLGDLKAAYRSMIQDTLHEIRLGLLAFDETSADLVQHLGGSLASASPLLSARIELAEERIRSDEAQFQAEVIRTRERARLEAMAFEI